MAVYLHAAFLRDSKYLAWKEFCAGLPPHSLDAVHEHVPAEFSEYARIDAAALPDLPSVVVYKGGGGAPSPGAALLKLESHLWIWRGMEYLELVIEQQLDDLPTETMKKTHKVLSRAHIRLAHQRDRGAAAAWQPCLCLHAVVATLKRPSGRNCAFLQHCTRAPCSRVAK